MAVTAVLLSPPSGVVLPLNIIRPATSVRVHSGVGNYDVDFQWDTVTTFDSGNLITVSQNNVAAGTYSSVPTADLDSGSTWYTRVTVDDLGDGTVNSSTSTLTWYDPIDDDRFLYTYVSVGVSFDVTDEPPEGWEAISGSNDADGAEIDFDRFLYTYVSVGIGFEGTPPAEGWRIITGSDPGDGDELDFDRFLYTYVSVGFGFEDDPPTEGWRQITGSEPADGDQLDFDRFLYAAANVFLGLDGSGHASSEGTGDMDGGKTALEAFGGGHATSDGSGKFLARDDVGRFRLRKATGGSTLRGGNTLQGAEAVQDVDLAGAGDAAADATAVFTVEVGLAGGGDAAADADAAASVTRKLVGDGHAASDADAAFTIQVFISGDGHAASDGFAQLTVGNEEFLAGSGHAAADASASLTLSLVLVGDGHGAADADAVASVTRTLSGSGHAAGDSTADLEEKTFLVGSGHVAADSTATLLITRGIAGAGDAAADATADMDVAVSVSLSGSGHAASDGVGFLAGFVNLVVDIALPALTIAHNPAGLTSPPLVGGIVSPSSSQFAQFSSASAFATQTDDAGDGVNYSPILRDRNRQVIGRTASGLLTFAPWQTTDPTEGGAYEIHYRPGDWMSTPNSPDYEVTSELDIRVFGKFFVKAEWQSAAFLTKNQSGALWSSDGDWLFYSNEVLPSTIHRLGFSFWDDSAVRRNFYSSEIPVTLNFPARMGVRVKYEVGGGDTTVSFYYSILRSPATWVALGSPTSLGFEAPVRFTDDYIELGSNNAGDGIINGFAPSAFYQGEGIYLNPAGHEGAMNGVDVFVDGKQVIKMDASMYAGNTSGGGTATTFGGSRNPDAVDASGRKWSMQPQEREGFNTLIHTHTRNSWNHNPGLAWEAFQPFPAWDDFGLHLPLTSGLT